MLQSILVALEESASCNGAVELGIRWAQRHEALLVGVAVVDEPAIRKPEPVPIGGGAFKVDRDETLLTSAHDHADRILDQFVRRCREQKVRCEALKENGSPGARILSRSKTYDLVMVGQQANFHSMTQEQDDETIWQLMRQSPRPVVISPETITDSRPVVVAYDGSLHADRALQAFVTLGLAAERDIHVLTIDTDLSAAASVARQASGFFDLHHLPTDTHPREPLGTISATIIQEVWDQEAGLLVMGACGRSRLREYVLGSTTAEVAANSRVPVFLIH